MKRYRFIGRGEHMPKDTEVLINGVWVPYYKDYQWNKDERNWCWGINELRRPLKQRKVAKTSNNSRKPKSAASTGGKRKQTSAMR